MPRTLTTVINDLIHQVGKPNDIHAGWSIPIERAGWDCCVSIAISLWKVRDGDSLYIAVHAHGYPTGGEYRGIASYTALYGNAPPSRLTRKWIDQVLRREIETAQAAALSFTENDLHEGLRLDFDSEDQIKDHRAMSEYFISSLP
jgi:hypothetical protein